MGLLNYGKWRIGSRFSTLQWVVCGFLLCYIFSFSTTAPKWSHANFITLLLLFYCCWHIFVFIYWLIGHWKDYSHSDTCNWLIFYCYCDCVFEIWCHVYNKSTAALSCGFALYMMYSVFGFYMTWCLLLWDSWYIIHNKMAFPQENIILLYHSVYWFSWLFQKDPFIQKKIYYHGVIFVVFFQLKVDIVYFYGFGAVLHLIF